MKLAAIDTGTNSTRLLISDYNDGKFVTLERKMEITRLGRDLDINNHFISADSARKTLKVISDYSRIMKSYDIIKYRAIGTSALRKAVNSKDFISLVEKETGIKIDIISGREEAFLSFYGAVKGANLNSSNSEHGPDYRILVIDIGGGSSEFILGDCDCNLEFTGSVDIGCVNLTERFLDSGVPCIEKINQMHSYVKERLGSTIASIKRFKPLYVIGVAGTITTLAAIDLKLTKYDSEKIHGHILDRDRIKEIYDFICEMDTEDRKKVTGLDPKRADIIIGGIAIVIETLKMLDCKSIYVSEKDILDGIIYTLADF
ncbi:MAG: Ppx/GppA phosphatase family protein [Actinomycetota bacterium]|nr:Ppx/GppA phosphatase family protein [Actinomycetota bacterium]